MKGNPYDAGFKWVSRQGVPLFYPTLGKGYPSLFRNIVQQLIIQRSSVSTTQVLPSVYRSSGPKIRQQRNFPTPLAVYHPPVTEIGLLIAWGSLWNLVKSEGTG